MTINLSPTNMFLCGAFLITMVLLICYVNQQKEYDRELTKIILYEENAKKEQQELDKIRALTIPCAIPNLMSPRSCYFDSHRKCSWNMNARRCDQK